MANLTRSKNSKLANEKIAQSQTKLGTEMVLAWYSSAVSLERGASILWDQVTKDWDLIKDIENVPDEFNPSISEAFMLLAGLSVENLLKANCVKIEGAWNEKGKFNFQTHDFIDLANHSGLEFTVSESELLERLEHFVVFAGRYPAPTTYKRLVLKEMSDGSLTTMKYIVGDDFHKWKDLVKKLKNSIE